MSSFVIDSSVAIKWYIREEGTEQAHDVLNKLNSFYAPDIFVVELDSALTKKVRRRDISIKEAFKKRLQYRQLPSKLIAYKEIEEFAFRLATEFSVTIYDASYLAIAIDYDAVLYTSDLRLSNGLSTTPFAKYVEYVGK